MNRTDTFEERIRIVFDPSRFDFISGPADVVVEETKAEGLARIACHLGEGHHAIRWKLQSGDFRLFASDKNADGAILVRRADGALEAHIMECKQTVDSNTWRKVLVQLEWTLLRLLAIAGALNERIERVVLYTAFFRNRLAPDESADAALYELPLGGADDARAKRERPMTCTDMETQVELSGWGSSFLHVKVRKDERGHASVDLRIGQPTTKLL